MRYLEQYQLLVDQYGFLKTNDNADIESAGWLIPQKVLVCCS